MTKTYFAKAKTDTGYVTRASGTMHYTHVVLVDGDTGSFSWHQSAKAAADGARKAQAVYADAHAVTVESREGSKAKIEKQLAAELAEVKELGKAVGKALASPEVKKQASKSAKANADKKAAAKAAHPAAKKPAAKKAAPRWTKGEKLAGGYTVKWVHGYYCLAQKPVEKTIRRYEWIAILSDGHKITAAKDGAKLSNAKQAEELVREYKKTMKG